MPNLSKMQVNKIISNYYYYLQTTGGAKKDKVVKGKKNKMKSLQDMSINTIINSYDVDEYIKKLRENNYSSVIIDQIEDKHIKKEFQFLKEYLRKLETYNRKSLASIAWNMTRDGDLVPAVETPEQVLNFVRKYNFHNLKEVVDIMDSPASGFSFSKNTFLNKAKEYFDSDRLVYSDDFDDIALFAQLGLILDVYNFRSVYWYINLLSENTDELFGNDEFHNPFYLPYLKKIIDQSSLSQRQLDDLLKSFINLDYTYLYETNVDELEVLDIIKDIINRF